MARVAKGDVHRVLENMGQTLIDAGGKDGRVSRADVDEKVKGLKGAEKGLAATFFSFVDHRDHAPGATVTAKDINKAVEYAKTHLVDKYDLNQNGLSQDEISKMSKIGKLAVHLAKELKAATFESVESASQMVQSAQQSE